MAEGFADKVNKATMDDTMLSIEAEQMAKQYERYNVLTIGNSQVDHMEEVYRWMYCQLNSALVKESRDIKYHEIM